MASGRQSNCTNLKIYVSHVMRDCDKSLRTGISNIHSTETLNLACGAPMLELTSEELCWG